NARTMKIMSDSEFQDAGRSDLRPEYNFDYRKGRPNRFAGRADRSPLVLTLDSEIARHLTVATIQSLIAVKWREFASDLEQAKKNLGVGSNQGLLLAGVLIPLLQAFESDQLSTTLLVEEL